MFREVPRFLKGREGNKEEEGLMAQERLLRPSEVAGRLGISRSSVYRWYWEGKLKGVKLAGGPVRIFESAVCEQMSDRDGLV
jgi:excisionase family DNA binding protein